MRCLHYRALILLKVPQESASQSLQSLVPMVPSQLASNRCWHQNHIVMAEEGKLLEPVTWQTAHTELLLLLLLLMMMMILYFWKGLLVAEAHGSNRKARFLELVGFRTATVSILFNQDCFWRNPDCCGVGFCGFGIPGHLIPQTKPNHKYKHQYNVLQHS